jgi:hypothetical protein
MSYKEAIQMLLADPEKMHTFFEGMMNGHYDNEDYWKHICKECPFTLEFIKQYVEKMNWEFALKYQSLDEDCLGWLLEHHYFSTEEWSNCIMHQKLSEEMISVYIARVYPDVDWNGLAYFQVLTDAVIDKYIDEWDWETITLEQNMSLAFIDKYRDRLIWKVLPLNSHIQFLMDDAFVEKYREETFWENIGLMTNVSIDCLLKNRDKITENGWYSIFVYSDISVNNIEKLIAVLPDKLNHKLIWESISTHQDLSIEFIERHTDKLDWNYISANQELSWEAIERHHDKISLYYLSRNTCLDSELIEKIEQNPTLFKDTLDKDLLSL